MQIHYGYYEAKVDIQIHSSLDRNLVSILIYPARYRLKTFDIHLDTDIKRHLCFYAIKSSGIELNKPYIHVMC